MHQIHKESGKRIRYQKIVPGMGPVDTDEIVKGYDLGDDTYVVLEPDELDAIKLETKRTVELVQFVDYAQVDPRYFERPYYVVPDSDVSEEGYVVIREALRRSNKVGLGQITLRGRENLVAVKPCGKGLLMETLRYADELRAADPFFEDIPDTEPDEEMIELASQLIERKTAPFDASAFKDSYADALADLIEEKRKGRAIVAAEEEPGRPRRGAEVVDLMEALKRSVEGGKGKGKSSGRKQGSKKSQSRQRKAG